MLAKSTKAYPLPMLYGIPELPYNILYRCYLMVMNQALTG